MISLLLIGLLAGLVSSLFGIGGGAFLVPVFLLVLNLSLPIAIGTSLAVIVPTALTGAIKYYTLGNVDTRIFILVSTGAIVGAFLGTYLMEVISPAVIKRMYGAFLIVIGLNFLFGWGDSIKSKQKQAEELAQVTASEVNS